jgi:hypothetical protein
VIGIDLTAVTVTARSLLAETATVMIGGTTGRTPTAVAAAAMAAVMTNATGAMTGASTAETTAAMTATTAHRTAPLPTAGHTSLALPRPPRLQATR